MTSDGTTMMTPRNLAIWGACGLAALWLMLTAAGAVTQENQSRAALMLFPKNGFAYQSRAIAGSIGTSGGLKDLHVGPEQIADAREALRREPLASGALAILGFDAARRGDGLPIMTAVHRLDRRQLLANTWLINYYGTRGGQNSDTVLSLLDEALKVRPGLAAQYMPAFAQALANPDTVPAFQRLLAAKPAWEMDFWRAVSVTDAALPNAEVLRSRMLARGEKQGEIDTMLMAAFVRIRRMDLALSYAKRLPSFDNDRDNLLRNASFDSMPEMPPLDWELTSDGRMGAAIDEARGTLNVNAIAGSSGTIARQLVGLTPGSYQLLVKLGRADFARGTDLRVAIRCAETNGDDVPAFTAKVPSDIDSPFAIPADSRCRFFWVELIFSAMDSSGPASTSIAEVKIVRARRVQETEAPAEQTAAAGDNVID